MKRMSAIHPNGFWIYLLKMFKNGSRLRLHYWPRGSKRPETPHDHRSWFISIPLWNRFLEKRYVEVRGDDYQVVNCHATTSGNGRPLTTPGGYGSVQLIDERKRYPLLPYFCDIGQIHAYQPTGDGPALSLVFFGPPKTRPRAWNKT